MNYLCKKCGFKTEAAQDVIKCPCGGALWLDYSGSLKKEDIDKEDFSMWRYSKAYPVKRKDVKITFGEGLTPLAKIDYKGFNVQIKQDYLMPTGSFKDRGVTMVTNFMHNLGVNKFAEDSSGNGGSSFAGFCALGNIDLKVFVPAGTSEGKVAQMKVYNADLVEVEGSRQDVAIAAMEGSEGYAYVGHNWHPLFVQGTKSLAYELWEQNAFVEPDQVICVAGNGSMVIGLYLGFSELLKSGEIKQLPKIFAIQSSACNPLYRAFTGDSLDFEIQPSIAEGIRIKHSTKHDEIIEMIQETNGSIISVDEKSIKEALFEIGQRGFYIEPTSATAIAGLDYLINENLIERDEKTAVIISGNGLKATDKIMKIKETLCV